MQPRSGLSINLRPHLSSGGEEAATSSISDAQLVVGCREQCLIHYHGGLFLVLASSRVVMRRRTVMRRRKGGATTNSCLLLLLLPMERFLIAAKSYPSFISSSAMVFVQDHVMADGRARLWKASYINEWAGLPVGGCRQTSGPPLLVVHVFIRKCASAER